VCEGWEGGWQAGRLNSLQLLQECLVLQAQLLSQPPEQAGV
jgi:hypothetical protein